MNLYKRSADLARSSLTHLSGPCAVTVAALGLKDDIEIPMKAEDAKHVIALKRYKCYQVSYLPSMII